MSARAAVRWIAIASLLVAPPALATEWQKVAFLGDPAPGMPEGSVVTWLREAAVRDDGIVFFAAAAPLPARFEALYAWSAATGPALIARLDDAPTSAGDPSFSVHPGIAAIRIHSDGPTVVDRFASLVACPPASSTEDTASFILDGAGTLVPVVGPGAAVPGIEPGWIFDGSMYLTNDPPLINAQGELAFLARIERANVCDADPYRPIAGALFGPDGSGGITLAAISEQQAPGESPGAAIFPTILIELNDAGELAFAADLRLGPSGPTVPAVYRWDAMHGLRPVARKFAPAPGGGSFVGPAEWALRLGDGGHVVFDDFEAFVASPFGGIYAHDEATGLRAVVRRGDVLPGAPAGFVVRDGGGFAVNANGEVAFAAQVGPPDTDAGAKWGVWAPDRAGEMVLRLLDGQPAPGLAGLAIHEPSVLAFSDERRLLVETNLEGPGTNGYERVWYIVDATGPPRFLARVGDSFDVEPGQSVKLSKGDLRSDSHLRHFAVLGGGPFNEPMLFYAAVPEPAPWIGGLAAFAALGTLRRRA